MTETIKFNSHIDPVDYVLDVLSNHDKKAVEQHITQCDECLEAIQSERLIEQKVRDSIQALSIPSDAKLMAFMPKPPEPSYYRSPFRRSKVGWNASKAGFGSVLRSDSLSLSVSWFSPALSMTMILFLFCGFLFFRSPASVAIGSTSTSTSTSTVTMTATLNHTATAIAYESSGPAPEFTPVPNATPIAQLVPIRANQLVTNAD
ncbi:MAG: hypothetical protein AAF633_22700 [Chloroflexota bacterium]